MKPSDFNAYLLKRGWHYRQINQEVIEDAEREIIGTSYEVVYEDPETGFVMNEEDALFRTHQREDAAKRGKRGFFIRVIELIRRLIKWKERQKVNLHLSRCYSKQTTNKK